MQQEYQEPGLPRNRMIAVTFAHCRRVRPRTDLRRCALFLTGGYDGAAGRCAEEITLSICTKIVYGAGSANVKNLDFTRYALSTWVAASILSACGGSQPPQAVPSVFESVSQDHGVEWPYMAAPAAERPSSGSTPEYKVSVPPLYVANFTANHGIGDVTVYAAKANDPSPIAVITKGLFSPGGVCIDGNGILYVGNDPGSGLGWISEYPLGRTKPSKRITKGIDGPAFCTIDGQGNLWVANAFGPNVTEYLKGSTTPHTTIENGLTHPDGIAIDQAGNLYVGNLQPTGISNVQEYAPGAKSPSRTITAGVTWPVGIAVDADGTLYVTNGNAPCDVEEYRAGQSSPYRAITDEINGPTGVTLGKSGWLYESNGGVQGCSGPWPVILEFKSGSITPSNRTISKGLNSPLGIAYYPPLLP